MSEIANHWIDGEWIGSGTPTLKRMNLELGGKTPMIVFDDADLEAAVPLVASAVTTFAGRARSTRSEPA
jgi:betaine-aldehyde dehydrogenase